MLLSNFSYLFYPRYSTNKHLQLEQLQFLRLVIVLHLISGRTSFYPFGRICYVLFLLKSSYFIVFLYVISKVFFFLSKGDHFLPFSIQNKSKDNLWFQLLLFSGYTMENLFFIRNILLLENSLKPRANFNLSFGFKLRGRLVPA